MKAAQCESDPQFIGFLNSKFTRTWRLASLSVPARHIDRFRFTSHVLRVMNQPILCSLVLCFIAIRSALAQNATKEVQTGERSAFASKSTVLLVRHAEKPEQGTGLTPEGQRHAVAFVDFFTHYRLGRQSLKVDALFAAKDSVHSMRSRLTLTPLSSALKLPLNTAYEGKDFAALAARLRGDEYKGKTVVVCWKHGEILALAEEIGVDPGKLAASQHWPAKWPDAEFRWILQIVRDQSGAIDPVRTQCIRNPPVVPGLPPNAGN